MTHPAYQKMLDFNRQHIDSKEIYKKMQLWHLKNNNGNGVFCPTDMLVGFSQRMQLAYLTDKYKAKDYHYMSSLHTFGAWRNSLGIYKIDDDVVDDVTKSAIPNDTPISIFERLPEFCVYFDISNASYNKNIDIPLLGFWALYDYLPDVKNHRVLKIVFDFGDKVQDIATEVMLSIDTTSTVEQSLLDVLHKTDEYNYADGSIFRGMQSNITLTKIALSFLLWLCAETPDITSITGEPIPKELLRLPRYTVNKKTGTFIVPNAPFFYDIAKRLGGEIRTFNEHIGQSDDRVSSNKRPHIRKGHWHGHWRGTGQAKEFFVKWQPATFVNASI